MIKILVQIKDSSIYFKIKKSLNDEQKNLLNTNIISDNELVFSDEYIYQNLKIVTKFINEIVKEYNVNEAIIYNNKVINEILDILINVNSIKYLTLKDDVPLNFKMCEKIVKTNIEALSCFTMQDFLVDYLDKNNIIVESRSELFFISKFMKNNELNKYSSIYYKKSINLDFPLNDTDIDDINAFLSINQYLRIIHINKTIKDDFEEVINLLTKFKRKNIKIVLHENISNVDVIEYIKKINKPLYKKYKIKISISYSDNYLYSSFLPQTNIGILKFCVFITILICLGSFGYVLINNYYDFEEDKENKDQIQEHIKLYTDSLDTEKEIQKLEEESNKKVVNNYIASLLTLNQDTTGWLKVNNTLVDYPVLKADDNDYYIDKNIYHEKDSKGWIFMDYRNSIDYSDDNTIIYGHTNYNSQVMFGSLHSTKTTEWRSVEENMIITVDSLYENLEYEIFSIYTIDPVTDYLQVHFSNDLEKLDFFSMLHKRSDYEFDVELDYDDKIITLSTCAGSSGVLRLVVHAVLID